MGKTLVIKDADFSENHVDVSPIYYNGAYTMTGTNYKSHFNKAPINSMTDWSAYNASYHTFSYPVKAGSIITLRKEPESTSMLYSVMLTNTEGGYSEAIDYMTGKSGKELRPALYSTSIMAPEDGFFMIEYSPNQSVFPGTALVRPYESVDRTISESTADYGINKYLKSDGTYGNAGAPTGKNGCSFFSVFKGEVVNITAQSGKDAVYCLMEPFRGSGASTIEPSILSGQSRQTLSAGSSVQLEIPEDCLLYLWNYDGNTNHFPESVSVTRVEL